MHRDFDVGILDQVDHRPWPMPERPWLMTQSWHDLLFAHWTIAPALLRRKVPDVFPLDLLDGRAWVGVVPFHMTNVAPRGVPSLPWVSEFPELNVRTYVRVGDKPGIYFFSLDAGSAIAATAARTLLALPYYTADITVELSGTRVNYRSARRGGESDARFEAMYEPTSDVVRPLTGTIEYFLTERYCLYNLRHGGRPYRLDIHHPPWPLQRADATILANTMLGVHGLAKLDSTPLLHFAKRQDMVAWAPSALGAA
jgi:uncharacterized protein YqjF (DUF2071 family)